jgi:hypothetical protein
METNMLALFLGAGFSKWAGGLPLGSQLFDFAIEPFGVREERRLQRLAEYKQEWDSANPGGVAEQFIATVLCGDDGRSKEDVLWYIARRLSQSFIWQEWHAGRQRRHVLMIDEYRKWERPGVQLTANFINQCGIQLSGIVTCNYDLLVEYALGSKGFNHGVPDEILQGRGPYPVSQWRNPVRLAGRLPFAKLHGSIAWDVATKYTDGRRALSGKALIVAPTPNKTPPRELESQWRLSERILGDVRRLLVFGFAFNAYDEAVLAHLREAGRNVEQVAIVDVDSRVEAAKKLWPTARIRLFSPPPEGRAAIRAWINGA